MPIAREVAGRMARVNRYQKGHAKTDSPLNYRVGMIKMYSGGARHEAL